MTKLTSMSSGNTIILNDEQEAEFIKLAAERGENEAKSIIFNKVKMAIAAEKLAALESEMRAKEKAEMLAKINALKLCGNLPSRPAKPIKGRNYDRVRFPFHFTNKVAAMVWNSIPKEHCYESRFGGLTRYVSPEAAKSIGLN